MNKQLFGRRFKGMALWPFLILKDRELQKDPLFMNHEKIHLRQQLELLVLPFLLWYLLEFLFQLVRYGDRYKAYKNICFEREAYSHEMNEHYLEERKPWVFLGFL